MAACGTGPCACRGVEQVGTGQSTLAVRSTTSHTLRLITDLIGDRHEVERHGRLLQVRGGNLAPLVLEIDAALTSPEGEEARAVLLDDGPSGDQLLSRAMTATSVKRLAARIRFRHVAQLTEQPERFRSRFQPIVDLVDGQLVGHEALLRATDDRGRELPASELFGAAAAGGWTNALDRIGREVAIRDAAPWLDHGLLFINFVPTSVYRPELCLASTTAAADRHGIDLRQVVFEVVETDRTDDPMHLTTVIEHYRSRGARIALDDVGSGYSSLNLVARLRPDIVKLDMELVQALPDPAAVAIVRAIIDLSRGIDATVIAEGLETEEQRRVAQDLGADWGQGWLFGRPQLPADLDLAAARSATPAPA